MAMDLDTNTFSYMDLSCLGDAFRIDDLSDISNEDIAGPIPNDGAIAFVESASCSSSVKGNADINAPDVQFPPLEEEIGLEWLSDFVQDSFADTAANRDEHRQIQTHVESKHCSEQKGTVAQDQTLKMVIPCRARSKRSRIRVWPSEPGDVSRMLEQARASWPPDCAPVPSPPHPYDQADKRARKKQVMAGGAQPRRCSHCQSQKTPQWRAGPLGPKSLCNACGVRYKSGRLLPEYRPAKSPTFVSYKHSNSHKKVLEMRRSSQSSFC